MIDKIITTNNDRLAPHLYTTCCVVDMRQQREEILQSDMKSQYVRKRLA